MPELPFDPALAPTVASGPESPTRVIRGERARSAPGEAALLAPGTIVAGQYRIEAELGTGGMGVVYRARDQRLDRTVALKLCHAMGARSLARFEREAMALARLNHPNVVTVYQVGEQDGRLFIVMEAVPGGTARAWAPGRTWREIVALYAAAGEGLAAAHDAGLVHRDFKPDNVLVGDDGRPRVGDFGLAHAAADASGDRRESPWDEIPRALGSGEVTRTGSILGTPAYMPPEQRAGRPLDARADQYAFCVALWEALFDELPYAAPSGGASEASGRRSGLLGLVTPGRRRPAPAARGGGPIPRHVVDALRRGLSAVPGDRWPSMAALVAELRRDPRLRRRRLLLAGGTLAAAALAGAAIFALARSPGAAPCTDGPERLAPVWSAQRAASIEAAVGPAAWGALGPALGRFADGWIAAHAGACGAPRAASQPADLRERRMACLARVRAELDGFLDELAAYPQQAPALDALSMLTSPDACAADDPETPPPADPAALARIERAARVIARAQAALARGAQTRASLLTNDALALARAAGWRVQIAQALSVRAWALSSTGRQAEARAALEEAVSIALAERSDREAALAMADLAELIAAGGRGDEARRMLSTARRLWERMRDQPTSDRIAAAEVQVALAGGRTADAVAAARARAKAAEAHHPAELAAAWAGELARVLVHAGAYEEAATTVERGIAASEQRLGRHAPVIQPALGALVAARLKLGRYPEALEAASRAVSIAERAGAEGTRMSDALAALGEAARATSDLATARAAFERSLQIERELGPGRRSDLAMATHNLAIVEAAAGDLARAGRLGAEALATLEELHGKDDPILIHALVLAGHVAREGGELAASEAYLRRAVAIAERELGPEHHDTVNNRIELASTLVRAKRPQEAIALLEPIVRSTATTPASAAEARFGLARALVAAGAADLRARALAADARDRYRALGDAAAPQAAEIEAWLTAGGRR